MAFSIDILSDYLSELDFGPSMKLTSLKTEDSDQSLPWKGLYFPWNGLGCLSVVCYVLKFCTESEHGDVFDTIRRLNDMASEYKAELFQEYLNSVLRDDSPVSDFSAPLVLSDYVQSQPKRQQLMETFVNIFWPKVQQFFIVPKGKGHLAGFIDFLLQILNSEPKIFRYVGLENESITNTHHLIQTWLKTSLNFFLVVLGDAPFQLTDVEQVKNVLMEFEVVANDTGRFIYSCFFRKAPVYIHGGQRQEEFLDLIHKVNTLKEKIEEHCIEFSKLAVPFYVNPVNSNAVGSLFIVESLLKDIRDFMTMRDDLTDELKHQTTTLHEKLLSAQSFLENTNVPDESEIQELRIRIRDAAYEAEYVLNSFVVEDFSVSYFALRLPMIIHKFELIIERFAKIPMTFGIKTLKLEKNHAVEALSLKSAQIPRDMDHNVIVGFSDEMIQILNELTGESSDLKFICIYGMPGLGKTMLANRLYNHRLVTDRFDECAWCVASQTYLKRNMLIDILSSLRRNMMNKDNILEMDDKDLTLEIHKTLCFRRFLIVIDDVWDSVLWNDLRTCFRNDRNGSRILFTTRIQDTAPINSLFCTPPFLSRNQCWEIIEKKVFRGEPCPPQLQDCGKRIAAKCKGLPLVAVVIAGALVNLAKEKTIWDKLEGSLDTYSSDCLKLLELSYHQLPDHLKLCYLYLGLFPTASEIPVRKLINLWIAEGFIRKDKDKSQEHVAEEYLMDLVNRSLIHVAKTRSTGGVKACRIHDLLRDMCLQLSQEENFLNLIENVGSATHEKHQRFSLLPTAPVHLRPFSLHCRSYFGHLQYQSSSLPQMKRLRVMELALWRGVRHINTFKNIKLLYLRYLVIDKIKLEPVLDNLVNLEVLRIDYDSDVDISRIILKMVNLKHLYAPHAKFLTNCNSSQANNLQSLSLVHMLSINDYENLRYLTHLRKLKCICEPTLPDLCFLPELESLKIRVIRTGNDFPRYSHTINFPLTIKKLTLLDTRLPWERISVLGRLPQLQALKLHLAAFEGKEWKTSDDQFQKLMFLELVVLNLEQWVTTSDHFPILRHLFIGICSKLENIPTELGDIPTLHTIEVHDCSYGASISAVEVEQEQRDNGNKELQVIVTNRRWSKEQLVHIYKEDITSTLHVGVLCDECGTFPIVGDIYRCKDCVDLMSYDLCGACYASGRTFKLPPFQFNPIHTREHTFEIAAVYDQNIHSGLTLCLSKRAL